MGNNKNAKLDIGYIPTLETHNNILYVKEVFGDKLTRNIAGILYRKFTACFKDSHPLQVKIDLSNVSAKDIHALAFIDSCGLYCSKQNVRICISGVDKSLNEMLEKLEFKDTCKGFLSEYKIARPDSVFVTIGKGTSKFIEDTKSFLGFIGELSSAVYCSIRHPGKVQWKETIYYMDKSGANAVPIVFLICFLMGAILAFQGVVQMGRFGLSVYVANLVGLSIVKELGALMVAIICIGRAGSAFAAEIGTMKVSEELDAMETMGLNTNRFLVMPKIIALVCVMPLLTIIGDVAGILGGMVVGVLKSGISVNEFYLRTIQAISTSDMLEGIMKSVIFAILIAAIGCLRGFEANNDAKGVGSAATSSVVSGIFLIVIADAVITALIS
jgi:phospholipid/cholesterol/gamma-HCH transport system permease protein